MFILEDTVNGVDVCGELGFVVSIVSFILTIIQWAVPIILIIIGTIDLVKAVMAGKDDDIKKNQSVLIKRVVAAIIVFLVPLIVSVVMGLIGNDDWKDCWQAKRNGDIKSLFSDQVIKPSD